MPDVKICFNLVLVLSGICSASFPYDWSNLLSNFNLETGRYEKPSCRMTALPPVPSSMCCGIDTTSSNHIIGGKPTSLYQYPWMALIEYKSLKTGNMHVRCAGSLISGRYVLTAAHCLFGNILNESIPMNVILGDYDKFHDGPDCILINGNEICTVGELRIPIWKYFVHPERTTTTRQHDVALIKLANMAPYGTGIRPICLPSMDVASEMRRQPLWLEVAGWGTMKMEKINKTEYKTHTSAVKRHLKIPLTDMEICKIVYSDISSKQMCAGGLESEGACMGDSGGPLMFNNRGQYEISGIVSYGRSKPCATAGEPGVFTNVYKYMDWIMSVMVKEERMDRRRFKVRTK